jgi:carboxypeptidase Q
MMEAMRILKTTGVPLRRTVRLGLWTGEEQGLLGSRAYVAQQFANRQTMELKPAHGKMSVYFNMDNGAGAIRGVYAQGNTEVRPIFREWMEALTVAGAKTTTIRNTGATDHISFDEVGLPGFQFIQDPIEYFTNSHHSSMDLYERVQPDDLMRNAVIIASFVFQAANRDELLPRKPLPKPRTPR